MNRRALLAAIGLGAAPLLGGATTSIDLGGGNRRASLLIAGSDEFHPYAVKLTEGFAQAHPLIDTLVEAGGTDPGLLALKRGAIDIALASRELSPQEDDKLTRAFLVARDAIALVVNPANPLEDIGKARAGAVLRGEVDDWAKLGGPPGPIRLFRRKADAGTQKAMEKLVLEHAEVAHHARVMESGVRMREAVSADPGAFGFLALHDVTPAVKVLAVNAVPISRATILSGRYPYARSFFCITHGEHAPAVEQYLSFALGRKGQDLLADLGLIAVR